MIVIVAGMYRSGSTFSFNIVRELLEARGGATTLSSNSLDATFLAEACTAHIILKSHIPDDACIDLIKSGTALCICTFRKPEDAIASWSAAFGFDINKSLEMVREWLIRHRSIAQYATNISYEKLDLVPLEVILELQRVMLQRSNEHEALSLRIKYDRKKIKTEYDQLQESERTANIGFSFYDKITLFHRRHVTSVHGCTAKEFIGEANIARIRYELREFVDVHGDYNP